MQGKAYADALFASDYAVVAAFGATPGDTGCQANAGDFLLLYATGLGPTNPPYLVGQVLDTAYPISDLSQVSVMIGGRPASVTYAGLPILGVFQINIQVPSGVTAGDQPIVLRVGDQTSQSDVYLTFSGL